MKRLRLEYPEIELRDDDKICEPKLDKFGHIQVEKYDDHLIAVSVGWNTALLVDASELVDVIKLVSQHGESIADNNEKIRHSLSSSQVVDRKLDEVPTKTVKARRTAGGSKGNQ